MTVASPLSVAAVVEHGAVAVRWDAPSVSANGGDRISVRIARLVHGDFTYGVHYADYFKNFQAADGETIHVGPTDEPGVFVDRHVTIGQTYSYWVIAEQETNDCFGTAHVKVRDPRVWWTYRDTQRFMAGLAATYGDAVRMDVYGSSVAGHPIEGVVVGNPERIVIAFVGLIHPGESGPELILPVLERLLADEPELLSRCGLAALPSVNRDERDRLATGVPYYLRTNAAGVDLNRNFEGDWHVTDYTYGDDTSDPNSSTYRGPYAASEPETQAVLRFVGATRPQHLIGLHWLASVTGDRFLGSKLAADDRDYRQRGDRFGDVFSQGFRQDGEASQGGVEWVGCAGSMPSWAYRKLGIVGLDAEHYSDELGQVCRFDHTTLAYLDAYRDRYFRAIKRVMTAYAKEDAVT